MLDLGPLAGVALPGAAVSGAGGLTLDGIVETDVDVVPEGQLVGLAVGHGDVLIGDAVPAVALGVQTIAAGVGGVGGDGGAVVDGPAGGVAGLKVAVFNGGLFVHNNVVDEDGAGVAGHLGGELQLDRIAGGLNDPGVLHPAGGGTHPVAAADRGVVTDNVQVEDVGAADVLAPPLDDVGLAGDHGNGLGQSRVAPLTGGGQLQSVGAAVNVVGDDLFGAAVAGPVVQTILKVTVDNQVFDGRGTGVVALVTGITGITGFGHNLGHGEVIDPQVHSGALILELEQNTAAAGGMGAHVGLDGILGPLGGGGEFLAVIATPATVLDGDTHGAGDAGLRLEGDDVISVLFETGNGFVDGAPAAGGSPFQTVAAVGAFCHDATTIELGSTVLKVPTEDGGLFCGHADSGQRQQRAQHQHGRKHGNDFAHFHNLFSS